MDESFENSTTIKKKFNLKEAASWASKHVEEYDVKGIETLFICILMDARLKKVVWLMSEDRLV